MALTPRIVGPHDGALSFAPGGDRYLTKLTGDETGQTFAMCKLTIAPGAGPPLHRHMREDELFLVLDGTMSFWVDGSAVDAPAGTVVFGPRAIPHTFKNRGREPARMALWLSPPGAEEFFRRIGAPPTGSTSPPTDELMIERILKLAPEYGIEILGPSPL